MKIIFWMTILLCCSFQVTAQNWETVGGSTNSHVRAFFGDTLDNVLYLGGRFKYAGGTEVNGIAKWDGEQYHPLGTGHDNCDSFTCPSFYSIIRYKDEIYVSNFGYSIGGVPIKGIAKWDGVKWDSVGSGIRDFDGDAGIVWGQLVYNDELYIYGRFPLAGSVISHAIVKWNDEDYIPLDFPYSSPLTNYPQIVGATIFEGQLYVGGQFATGPNVADQLDVARYDWENWYPVGGGIKGTIGDVNDLIVYKDELYICGNFRKSYGNAGNGIMKLKDDAWVDVGGSFDEETVVAHDMVIYHDDLYVFGTFHSVGGGVSADNAAKWDGEKWCGLGGDFDQRIERAVVFKDTIFIGGGFRSIDNDTVLFIAKWSGDYVDTCGVPVGSHTLPMEKFNLTISPNPAQVSIHITVQLPAAYAGIVSLSAYNILGQPLWQRTLPAAGGELQASVDVSTWPPGVYFISLEASGVVWVEKVLVR